MGVRATVVFTDLSGSTTVFEALGNARATQAVTHLIRWISDHFERYGGRIVKTLGDGVLAVFSVQAQAVGAVVNLQREHQKQLLTLPESERMPIRVGVSSGDIEIVDGDCYGDAVNVASRLNHLCAPGEIWINATGIDFSHPLQNGARARLLGPIGVRGRAEPCIVYQIEWREDSNSELLTQHGDFDDLKGKDSLGGEIELRYLDQSRRFRAFELPASIGRTNQSDFVVNDPRVSRTHARLEWRNGSIMLVDLSSYGCWIRFEGGLSDVSLRRDECVLHGQGEIALGASFSDLSAPVIAFHVLH